MPDEHSILPGADATNQICRPLRDLIARMMWLPVNNASEPDYAGADPDVLVELAKSAELAMLILHEGVSGIGVLIASTAEEIAHGGISACHITAVGRLLAELGEVLVFVRVLSIECSRYTADYVGNSGDCSHE